MNHRSEGHASFGHLQQNQLTRYIGTHRITHGRMDLLMPFSNGKAWLRAWARLNGCDKVSFVAGFPDDICTEISGCDIQLCGVRTPRATTEGMVYPRSRR